MNFFLSSTIKLPGRAEFANDSDPVGIHFGKVPHTFGSQSTQKRKELASGLTKVLSQNSAKLSGHQVLRLSGRPARASARGQYH